MEKHQKDLYDLFTKHTKPKKKILFSEDIDKLLNEHLNLQLIGRIKQLFEETQSIHDRKKRSRTVGLYRSLLHAALEQTNQESFERLCSDMYNSKEIRNYDIIEFIKVLHYTFHGNTRRDNWPFILFHDVNKPLMKPLKHDDVDDAIELVRSLWKKQIAEIIEEMYRQHNVLFNLFYNNYMSSRKKITFNK